MVAFIAPPGYGKTSALAEWAMGDHRPVAWLTADDADNDPVVLLSYLAAAIDRLDPVDPRLFTAMSSPTASIRTIVGRLLAAISGRSGPVLVAIDDAHRITDRACLDALTEFVEYLPPGSQVAMASRGPTGLPVPRWRVQGTILELGPRDLAMDADETAALVRALGFSVPRAATDRLVDLTEGWPALLALAARGFGRADGRDTDGLLGADVAIADYLRSEILEPRTAQEIAFLTRTSILERLNGPLCDAVLGQAGSAASLAVLSRAIPLVHEFAGSFRYHSILREYLRSELRVREPGGVAELHRRAATWLDTDGDTDEAVEQAFAAQDLDLAATLVGRAMSRYHWSGRRATMRAWLRRFGDQALEVRPWLAVLAAWEELGAGDVAATNHLADIAERGSFEGRPPDGTASYESARAMLRACMCRHGAGDALANAIRAVQLEPQGSRWRDWALWGLAQAHQMQGDPARADELLAEAVSAALAASNASLAYCILGHRTLLAIDRLDWTTAIDLAQQGSDLDAHGHVEGDLSSAFARVARVRLSIHRGDIQDAHLELARMASLRPLLTAASPATAILSLMGLARAHLAVGDVTGARTLLVQAGDVVRQLPDLGVLPDEVARLRAELPMLPVGGVGASALTVAELRVLAFLPYYLSFKEIGQRLGVKDTTVKSHSLAIYGKLGASTRSEAVELATESGLLERFAVVTSPAEAQAEP